jgi:hypothetical protein
MYIQYDYVYMRKCRKLHVVGKYQWPGTGWSFDEVLELDEVLIKS